VDSGLGTFVVSLSAAGGSDDPSSYILAPSSLGRNTSFSVFAPNGVALVEDYFGADEYGFAMKSTVSEINDAASERLRLDYFDHENIDPKTGQAGWRSSYDSDTNTFALDIVAADADGALATATIYFKVTNIEEPPMPVEPSTSTVVDMNGLSSAVYGMASRR